MNESARGADGYHRRKLFWIGVLALFTAAFTVSLRAAVSGDLKAIFLDPVNLAASGALIGGVLGAGFTGFALTEVVGMQGILLLVYISIIMFVFRHFAGPVEKVLSATGLLWVSSLLAMIGLYLLSVADSPASALVAATFWGIGVCFMWPTMLAQASARYPRAGAWSIGLIGSAGALWIADRRAARS